LTFLKPTSSFSSGTGRQIYGTAARVDIVPSRRSGIGRRRRAACLDQNSITYIAFAEDAESIDMYDAVLQFDAGGAWSWRRIERDQRGDGK
jgi:hypothetical protein